MIAFIPAALAAFIGGGRANFLQLSLTQVEIPLRISEGNLCVSIRIEDKQLWFALDSGGWMSSIDPAIATLIKGSKSVPKGAAVIPNSSFVDVGNVGLGGALLNHQVFMLRRSGLIGHRVAGTSERIAGVLGYNILRLLSLGIDFQTCRAWMWGGEQDFQAELLSPSANFKALGRITSERESLPVMELALGGKQARAVIDLGSYLSFLSKGLASALVTHLSPAGFWRTNLVEGDANVRIALLDELKIGNSRWEYAPTILSGGWGGGLSGVGWTLFAPLGRVLFDFNHAAIFAEEPRHTIGFLEAALSLYGASISATEFISAGGERRHKLRSIRTFFGLPVHSESEFHQLDQWTPHKREASALVRLYDLRTAKLQFVSGGKMAADYPQMIRSAKGPKAGLDARPQGVPFSQPGYYVIWNGHVNKLPSGALWVPQGDARVVSVGGLPALPPAVVVGNYRVTVVPKVKERIKTLWARLGWTEIEGPAFFEPSGGVAKPKAVGDLTGRPLQSSYR